MLEWWRMKIVAAVLLSLTCGAFFPAVPPQPLRAKESASCDSGPKTLGVHQGDNLLLCCFASGTQASSDSEDEAGSKYELRRNARIEVPFDLVLDRAISETLKECDMAKIAPPGFGKEKLFAWFKEQLPNFEQPSQLVYLTALFALKQRRLTIVVGDEETDRRIERVFARMEGNGTESSIDLHGILVGNTKTDHLKYKVSTDIRVVGSSISNSGFMPEANVIIAFSIEVKAGDWGQTEAFVVGPIEFSFGQNGVLKALPKR
jgi:hypothetical protein